MLIDPVSYYDDELDTVEFAEQKLRDLFQTYQGKILRFQGNGYSDGDVNSAKLATLPDQPLYLRIESIHDITVYDIYVDLRAMTRPLDPTHPALRDDIAQTGVVVDLLTWVRDTHRFFTYNGNESAWKLATVAG